MICYLGIQSKLQCFLLLKTIILTVDINKWFNFKRHVEYDIMKYHKNKVLAVLS